MAKKYRLIWLCPEFTPYHEVLFRVLSSDPEISLKVEVMMGKTQTHPYELSQNRPYEWGIAGQNKRVDYKLIKSVLKEQDSWVVVASYLRPTLVATMNALANNKRRFIYFTDTPLPQDIEWNSGMPCRRSMIRRLARRIRLQWIFKHAYRVFATGEPGKDAVVKLGCPSEKAVSFPFWVDINSLHRVEKPSKENKIFISVGQLIYRKGYDIAIKAFAKAQLNGSLNGIRFQIIGDGPDRHKLEQLVKENNLQEYILFSGWLQPPEVAEALRRADIFVHPARWDPFPVVVLEAMATGLPVLGSDASGSVLDRVEDGVSGFIHRTGDSVQLAEHLMKICSDSDIASSMGAAARYKAEEWPPERGVEIIKNIMFNE
ncbi:MAG: glycosyltransferase [Nitrospirota bacterium]